MKKKLMNLTRCDVDGLSPQVDTHNLNSCNSFNLINFENFLTYLINYNVELLKYIIF